ncbi:MAG TPA: pantoate--beta-alanine ligase, partial [Rhizomicrobium sp.]|nr:pantoate--beta-alanine ligase [Rhizomicrobium sp.]
IVTTVAALRTALAKLKQSSGAKPQRIGMVPTMGALHEGHLSLVRAAKAISDKVLVSIFVNPAQFAPHEDFDAYPRNLEADLAKLSDVDLVFAPDVGEMYPHGQVTSIAVGGPSAGLETDFRPHFFSGVATAVAKLLIAALPDIAVFGEKDYQQLLVVRRLARDLLLPVEILGVPIVREADGLALSSRNVYLSRDERKIAGRLNAVLKDVIADARGGGVRQAEMAGTAALKRAGFDSVDYLAIRDAETLAVIDELARPARVLAAAKVGRTRLIDNMAV